MKLEYLPEAESRGLVRLFDFTPPEAAQLLDVVAAMASRSSCTVHLHQLAFVESLAGCSLTLRVASSDQGLMVRERSALCCDLRWQSWDTVAGLIEPFTVDRSGTCFQWLDDTDIPLLLSPTGAW